MGISCNRLKSKSLHPIIQCFINNYFTNFLLLIFKYDFIIKENNYFFIYVSPPTSFLMERMNFDIFVVVIGYLALLLYLKDFKNISLVIITLLTMVKIFQLCSFLQFLFMNL